MEQSFGTYTFDIAYDNNIFEYVRSEGGTASDNKTRVRVVFFDEQGGSNPRSNMSVTFKAKADITSTNPTDFSITAEGLANNDGSQEYDDISVPIKKSVTVEPNYVDYTLRFKSEGKVIVNEENKMELITSSTMGRNYDHVKMKVEVTKKPSESATVKLLATERTRQEIDLIKDGWGEPDGYELGGKNVEQILDIRGVFSNVGEYKIKVSLLDKDSADSVIAEKEFSFNVTEKQSGNTENNNNQATKPGNNGSTGQTQKPEQNITGDNKDEVANKEEVPETLPKTGMTQYVYIITVLAVLGSAYIALQNMKKEK